MALDLDDLRVPAAELRDVHLVVPPPELLQPARDRPCEHRQDGSRHFSFPHSVATISKLPQSEVVSSRPGSSFISTPSVAPSRSFGPKVMGLRVLTSKFLIDSSAFTRFSGVGSSPSSFLIASAMTSTP